MINGIFDVHIAELNAVLFRNVTEVKFQQDGNFIALNDPVANRIVGSHYSMSHYCAGLLMLYNRTGNKDTLVTSQQLLSYIETTHIKFSREYDYHYDFNNFSWALLLLIDKGQPGFLSENIKSRLSHLLMTTQDSVHSTVNWLPMRALNNFVRFDFSNSTQYRQKAEDLLKKVSAAQNPDGMYDDLLPIGLSGNIQYHVFTTAILQLIRYFKLDNGGGSLEDALAFTGRCIDPDGDFNYFGRGANQIFGWGPFFFNLKGIECSERLFDKSLLFFSENLSTCLKNDGLLLSNSCPDQYNYWWDYHYFTVYASHLFFWLNLFHTITPLKYEKNDFPHDLNLNISSSEGNFCAIFNGKSHYLCERGPQICNIWTRTRGSLFKGPFGPFFGIFGQKHISKMMVVLNYFGPVTECSTSFLYRFVPELGLRLLRRFNLLDLESSNCQICLEPIIPGAITVAMVNENTMEIEFTLLPSNKPVSINIPIFADACQGVVDGFMEAEINGKKANLYHVGSAYGCYGRFELFRSQPHVAVQKINILVFNRC